MEVTSEKSPEPQPAEPLINNPRSLNKCLKIKNRSKGFHSLVTRIQTDIRKEIDTISFEEEIVKFREQRMAEKLKPTSDYSSMSPFGDSYTKKKEHKPLAMIPETTPIQGASSKPPSKTQDLELLKKNVGLLHSNIYDSSDSDEQ